MEDKILVNLSTDRNHTFESDTDIIGREGEGNTSRFEITIPEKLEGCSVYLDFEKPNGEKLRTPKLNVENGVAVYDVVKYVLTVDGEVKAQAVLQTNDGQIWKSSIKRYTNQNSINALEEIPEKEDFISEIQKLLDEVKQHIGKSAYDYAKDGGYKGTEEEFAQDINPDNIKADIIEEIKPSAVYITDENVAYTKVVPENALISEVQKLGGMTRKCTNLLPNTYTTQTISGVTFTVNNDGSITANGTATATIYFKLAVFNVTIGNTYYLSGCPSGGSWSKYLLYVDANKPDTGSGASFTATSTEHSVTLFIASGVTVSNITCYPMLNAGATALPYEPYFEGLRSAPVTSVESVGANLWSATWELGEIDTNGKEYDATGKLRSGFVKISYGETYTIHRSNSSGFISMRIYDKDKKFLGAGIGGYYELLRGNSLGNPIVNNQYSCVIKITNTKVGYIRIVADSTDTTTQYSMYRGNYTDKTMPAYTPYTKSTLPIPEAVQALDGYGEGNPDDPTEYNSIQWDKKGSCSYSHKGNIVNNEWVPLSNEIVTDISDLITPDNLITVYDKGTIKLVNEFGYDVPSAIRHCVYDGFDTVQTVTPQMFGAVGDGVTDDTFSFKFALHSGTKALHIPSGTYKVTSSLIIPNTVRRIYGDGKSVTIVKPTGICFELAEKISNMTFDNFSIIGTRRTGVGFKGATAYSHFKDLVLQDLETGFDFLYGSWGVTFDCITLSYVTNGIVGASAFNAFYAKGCAMNTCTTAFTCEGGQSIEFDKCTIEFCTVAFKLPQIRGFCLQNSYFEGCGNVIKFVRPYYGGNYTARNCYFYQNKTGNTGWLALIETAGSKDAIMGVFHVENCRLHGTTDGLTFKPFAFTNNGTYATIGVCYNKNSSDVDYDTYFDLFDLTNCADYGHCYNNPITISTDLPYCKQGDLIWYIEPYGNSMRGTPKVKFRLSGAVDVSSIGTSMITLAVPKTVTAKTQSAFCWGGVTVRYTDKTLVPVIHVSENGNIYIYHIDPTKTAEKLFFETTYYTT